MKKILLQQYLLFYEETVHFKPNTFLDPNGSVGRKFVRGALAILYHTKVRLERLLWCSSNFSFRSHIAPKYHHFPNVCKEGWIYGNKVISNNCCIIGVIPPQSQTLLSNLPVRSQVASFIMPCVSYQIDQMEKFYNWMRK